jgi:CMP-N-acetylneuraminic acid synthetase
MDMTNPEKSDTYGMKNLALVPIRTGSKRLPGKNIKDFFGKPIFAHTLEHAKNSGLFDTIMVSTESSEVADMCRDLGFPVPFLRPPELATDQAQLVQVVAHALDSFADQGRNFDNVCMLWATAPMRDDEDICAAYDLLFQSEETEAVVAVTDYYYPPLCAMTTDQDGYLVPMFPDLISLPGSRHPATFIDNGSMCWVRSTAFRKHHSWLPPKTRGYHMPKCRSVDLDDDTDWDLLSFYHGKYGRKT